MEEKFNVPLILKDIPLPIGLENTARWIIELAKYFNVSKRAESLIEEGEEKIDSVIGSSWEKYLGEKVGIKLTFDCFNPTNRDVYVDRAYFGYEGMLNILEVIGNDWEKAYRSKEIDWEESFK